MEQREACAQVATKGSGPRCKNMRSKQMQKQANAEARKRKKQANARSKQTQEASKRQPLTAPLKRTWHPHGSQDAFGGGLERAACTHAAAHVLLVACVTFRLPMHCMLLEVPPGFHPNK